MQQSQFMPPNAPPEGASEGKNFFLQWIIFSNSLNLRPAEDTAIRLIDTFEPELKHIKAVEAELKIRTITCLITLPKG